MWSAVTLGDFRACGWNSLYAVACAGAAGLTARLANATVHRFFKIEPGSYQSYAVQTCSVLVGVAASSCLMPYAPVQSLAGRKAAEIMAVSAAIAKVFPPARFLFVGALVGWIGWTGFTIVNSANSALIEVLLSTKKLRTETQV